MKLNYLAFIFLLFNVSCASNNTAEDSLAGDKTLTIKYLFEDNKDTVLLGDTIDFAMSFTNTEFDSLVIFLGKVDSLTLLDTLGIIEVKEKTAFFTLVPYNTGTNKIEGLVKQYNKLSSKTIVKSTPFSFSYYCKKPDSLIE
jgi:hypothetical protein